MPKFVLTPRASFTHANVSSLLYEPKGWSQTELADRLNTTLKMIDYYERRAHNPSVEFVRQAARRRGFND